MSRRMELALPVALSVLAAAAVLAWDPFAPGPESPPSADPVPVGPLEGARTPFDAFVAPAALVYVSDPGRLPANGTGLAGDDAIYAIGNGTAFVTIAHVAPAAAPCDHPCGLGLRLLPPHGPRLGTDSDLAMLSVYVFDDVGSLLATNTNDTRFGVPSARLPNGTWHFGEGQPPPGSTSVSRVANGILRGYAPLLHGAVAGSVVSARIDDHPYTGWIGPIFVTVRVDAVLV